MVERYFVRRILARDASICSMSSRNLRNMTHVSSGSRSRSPDRPLSLRMIWRQDLITVPSRSAVVFGSCDLFPRFAIVLPYAAYNKVCNCRMASTSLSSPPK